MSCIQTLGRPESSLGFAAPPPRWGVGVEGSGGGGRGPSVSSSPPVFQSSSRTSSTISCVTSLRFVNNPECEILPRLCLLSPRSFHSRPVDSLYLRRTNGESEPLECELRSRCPSRAGSERFFLADVFRFMPRPLREPAEPNMCEDSDRVQASWVIVWPR